MKIKASLKNRTILTDGNVILKDTAIIELLHKDKKPDLQTITAISSDEIEEYNEKCKVFGYEQINLVVNENKLDTSVWFIPDKYKTLDIEEYLVSLCKTEEELIRVANELILFKEREMYPLLQYLVFLVDFMKDNKIVWGLGRGSSVSSYCLFLIGIHKVDSIKYNLDIKEFLK